MCGAGWRAWSGFTREHELNRWLLSVYLLQALAADGLHNRELARDRLLRALEIAAPQDYVRALLDEGKRLLAFCPRCATLPLRLWIA